MLLKTKKPVLMNWFFYYELRVLGLEPEFNIRNGTSRSRQQFAYLGQH